MMGIAFGYIIHQILIILFVCNRNEFLCRFINVVTPYSIHILKTHKNKSRN